MTGRSVRYLICGSRLTDDTYVLRLLLEGLNTWGRQWQEDIVIQDDGSLRDLEYEVSMFKHLRHQRIDGWPDDPLAEPNVIFCFMDRMSMNRASERLLTTAAKNGRPAFIISGDNRPPEG